MNSKAKAVSKPRRASTTTSAPGKSAGPRPAKAGPPLFTEAERRQLLAVHDYIGLDYLIASRIRESAKPSDHQREWLRQHDQEEARIQSDPGSVLREAHQALDHGTDLLLKLIRSQKLRLENPISCRDAAFDCLASRIRILNEQLVRLAACATPNACHSLWWEPEALARAFVRLAEPQAKEFRVLAESSLTMPALVGPMPKEKHLRAVAQAIGLASQHPAARVKTRQPLGILCHHLIAGIVANILEARRERVDLERTARHTGAKDIIPEFYRPAARRHLQECWALPDLTADVRAWWSDKVKPMVHTEFERLRQDPSRNPALWRELNRTTASGTDAEKRAALDKYCYNKLHQIARSMSAKPT